MKRIESLQTTQRAHLLYDAPRPLQILLFVVLSALSAGSAVFADLLGRLALSAVACGLFAFAYALTLKPLYALTGVIGYAIAFLITGNPFQSGYALLFLAGGTVFSLLVIDLRPKTRTLISVSAAFACGTLLLFLIRYMAANGTIAPDAILASYSDFFDRIYETLRNSLTEVYLRAYEASESKDSLSVEQLSEVIEALARNTTNTVKLLIPGILCILFECASYIAVSVYVTLTRILKCEGLVPKRYAVTVSRTASILYIISYLVVAFSAFDESRAAIVFATTMYNLILLLTPGLFVLGLRSMGERFTSSRHRSPVLTVILLFIAFFINPIFPLLWIVLDGVIESLFGGIRRFIVR